MIHVRKIMPTLMLQLLCLAFATVVVAAHDRTHAANNLRTVGRELDKTPGTKTAACVSTYDDLRSSLEAAQSGATVWICPDTTIVVGDEILVNPEAYSVSVRCGSGSDSGDKKKYNKDETENTGTCTLSKGDNATGRLLNFSGGGATLNGITFTGGNVPDGLGGAVRISTASENGGPTRGTFAPVRVDNCTFYNNTASSGGALFVEQHSCSIRIQDCIFRNNTATAISGEDEDATGGGGALVIHQTDMQCRLFCPCNLQGVQFYNNHAPDSAGGAIWARSRIPRQCAMDVIHDDNTAGSLCPFMAIGDGDGDNENEDAFVCQDSL